MKVLVTGSKGQLGSEIHFLHQNFSKNTFNFTDIEEFDLSSSDKIYGYLKNADLDILVNCAAYTNVDGAEDNFKIANQVNHLAPKAIAKYCMKHGKRLIQLVQIIFSTVNSIAQLQSLTLQIPNLYMAEQN
jgi:dTDP-4-dehydrorhamnose reductase